MSESRRGPLMQSARQVQPASRILSGRDRQLVAVLVLSLTVRLIAAFLMGETVQTLPAIYDQVSYHSLAVRLIEGHDVTFDRPWWPMTAAGEPTAHWSYLYTLFLAGLYVAFGVHPLLPRLVQAIGAGLLMPWLTYRIAKRVFPAVSSTGAGNWIGNAVRIAAAWTALYGYFIYYAAALMTEAFYVVSILWTLDAVLRLTDSFGAAQQPRTVVVRWLELGLAIGVTILLRQVFLLVVPFLFAWLLWARVDHDGPSNHPRLLRAAVRVAGGGLVAGAVVAALIAPVTLFNYRQFGRLVLLNTNAGYAFYWANHPVHGDRFVPILTPDMPSYQALIPPELHGLNEAELDSALMQRAFRFVAEDPGRYLRLSLSRLPAYFIFWPSPDSGPVSDLVRVTSFGVALPFMLLGMGIWLVQARRAGWAALARSPGALLLLFAAVYSAIHLLSWALIRYRLPVDATLLPFAASGLSWTWGKIRLPLRAKRTRRLKNPAPAAGSDR